MSLEPNSIIEEVVKTCRRFETILKRRFGATGRGLHEKLTSVEAQIPPSVVKTLRGVASIRNKVMHEHSCPSNIADRFRDLTARATRDLALLADLAEREPTHVRVPCRQCSQLMRLPRNKTLSATCPHCGTEQEMTT